MTNVEILFSIVGLLLAIMGFILKEKNAKIIELEKANIDREKRCIEHASRTKVLEDNQINKDELERIIAHVVNSSVENAFSRWELILYQKGTLKPPKGGKNNDNEV